MRSLTLVLLIVLFGAGCALAQNKNARNWYKFHKQNKGAKAKTGDYVTVKMAYRSHSDSLLFDSSTRPEGTLTFPIQDPAFKGALEEGLVMMAAGDSATFKINADSLFLKTFGMSEVPAEIKKGTDITFHIKLVSILSEEEYRKVEEQKAEMRKAEEAASIARFLQENNIKDKTRTSGLVYIEQKKGEGAKAEAGKMVSVHYTGQLLTGEVFDSSLEREPFEFELGEGQVIPGWEEGLALMSEGGKARFIIPSTLAYGDQEAGPLPPYSTLIFDVELIKVSDANAAGPEIVEPADQPAKK